MKFNFFSSASPLFPFRWFLVVAFLVTGWLMYANLTGWRLLASSSQQQWNARGSGYHK